MNLNPQTDASYPWVDAEGDACYVSWTENVNGNQQVIVKHFDPAAHTWVQDGGPLNLEPISGWATRSSLALYHGTPYVAWAEDANITGYSNADGVTKSAKVQAIFVKRFLGGVWEQVGNRVSFNRDVKSAYSPKLKFDTAGSPVVSWNDDGIVAVRKWNGSVWEPMGNTLPTGGEPELVMKEDVPYVTWSATDSNYPPEAHAQNVVWVYCFKPDGWERLGGYLAQIYDTFHPTLVFGHDEPYVAWYEKNSSPFNTIRVKKFNKGSSAWEAVGAVLNVGFDQDACEPRIDWWNNSPVVAWNEKSKIYVKRFSAQSWELIGNNLNADPNGGGASDPRVAVSGNKFFLAWSETDSVNFKKQIYVKCHDGVFPAPTTVPGPASAYAQPNPFLPASAEKVRFYGSALASEDYSVEIFNMRGRRVRILHREDQWNGRNEQGNLCEGGVYVFQIKNPHSRSSGQIVLIR
ncbi:MAG: hypothetical protein HGA76_09900 [Candidatus Firestonebacteria bacterium]|nr:hypothetical protein [Candidatus Firestonebacteria bacterium]